MNKWSKDFWSDLAERVVATAIGALLTVLAANGGDIIKGTPEQWWTLVGLPTLLALLKGLLANMKDPESGASMLDHRPGPEVQ